MPVWQIRPEDPDPGILRRAADLLAAGGLVVIPTETYYGIAADLRRPQALRRVQQLKGRGADKPLLLLVQDIAAARALAPVAPPLLETLAARFWPGPLTMVLPAAPGLPDTVVSATGGVAVRQSPHPVTTALLRALGSPISGTSANRTGRPPARLVAELDLGGDSAVAAVLDAGATPGGPPSTLLDLTRRPPRVLRPGAIAPEALERLL